MELDIKKFKIIAKKLGQKYGLDINVELVDLKSAPPLLLKQVAEHSILLFESSRSIFALFKIYAYKLYVEAKPLFDLKKKQLNKMLKKYAG